MKATMAVPIGLLILAIASSVLAIERTPRQVEKGIGRAFVFAITPDEEGRASNCSYVEAQDVPNGASGAPANPSPAFIQSACEGTMGKFANWIPEARGTGEFEAVREICYWSKAAPDTPICRAELSFAFADEIPNGVGNIVVLELGANNRGELVSCESPEMMNLSTGEALDVVPHELYVADACRKLGSTRWSNSGDGKKFYFACRHVDEIPVRSFCEQKFGL